VACSFEQNTNSAHSHTSLDPGTGLHTDNSTRKQVKVVQCSGK
jgi:hypothetical protein